MGLTGYDFLDFGCSNGASIEEGQRIAPGARGLGLDIDPKKVEAAVGQGYDARVCDVTTLNATTEHVRFVIVSHFLEHLPGRAKAAACLQAACTAAQEFVYIRQPWFDSDGYLFGLGLKLYWSDWGDGHPYHMTTLDLHSLLRPLSVSRFVIYGRSPIKDSGSDCVHPLSSPPDQHQWNAERHPPKPLVQFTLPVWREMCALIITGDVDLTDLEKRTRLSTRLYDSGG